jgi:hypothetical protein
LSPTPNFYSDWLWPYCEEVVEVAKVLQEENQKVVFGKQNSFLFMRIKTKVKVHLQNF